MRPQKLKNPCFTLWGMISMPNKYEDIIQNLLVTKPVTVLEDVFKEIHSITES